MSKDTEKVTVSNHIEAREVILSVLRQVAKLETEAFEQTERLHGKEAALGLARRAIASNGGTQPESRSTSQVSNLLEDVRRAAATEYAMRDLYVHLSI